jgi:xylulokinase
LIEFDPDWLPPVVPATRVSGPLLPEAARDTGLKAGTPVAIGSGDSVVEALGVGAICPGQGIIKLGTAANVNLVTASPRPSPLSLTYRHVVDPHWFTITATNSGTATLRWFRDTFCRLEVRMAGNGQKNVYDLIGELAGDAPVGSEGVIFHPYLMGERTPYWDPNLRGNFFGLRAGHHIAHFARAVLEGVAFSIRDCLNAVQGLGAPVGKFSLIGGGAKSRLWSQILCDVLGQPLTRPGIEDAAFGSALLAGVAVGAFADWKSAVQTCTHPADVLQTDPEAHALYDQRFGLYRAIAGDLMTHSARLAQALDAERNNV